MKDIFKLVKANITTRQAAEHYGLNVQRNGMTLCPFHDDHVPKATAMWSSRMRTMSSSLWIRMDISNEVQTEPSVLKRCTGFIRSGAKKTPFLLSN